MTRTFRLQVPVKPETRKAIEDYAAALGTFPAAAAAQLLEESAPVLVDLTSALRKVHSAPSRALREAQTILHEAAEKADQLTMDLKPKEVGKKKTG